MSGPNVLLDPHPLDVTEAHARASAWSTGWEEGYRTGLEDRRVGVVGFIAGVVVTAVIAGIIALGWATAVRAAPRSADQPAIPAAVPPASAGVSHDAPTSVTASGNLAGRPPAAPITEPAAIEGGLASWYDDGPGLYAAVPSWRFGDRPYQVRVTAGDRSVVATVRDFCGCPGERIIDLSPAAFAELAPLSAGLVPVMVEDLGPGLTAPPTDVEP